MACRPFYVCFSKCGIKGLGKFGIEDRFGYSIVPGHGHCQLPVNQYPEVEAFLDKFLLGKSETDTSVRIAPADYQGRYDFRPWVNW